MSAVDLERYRKQLLKMLGPLRDESQQLEMELVEVASHPTDLSSVDEHNADHDTEGLEVEVQFLARDHELVREIRDALTRIRDGSYGVCQNCGERIAERRLEAIPYTRYCVDCVQAMDRRRDQDFPESETVSYPRES